MIDRQKLKAMICADPMPDAEKLIIYRQALKYGFYLGNPLPVIEDPYVISAIYYTPPADRGLWEKCCCRDCLGRHTKTEKDAAISRMEAFRGKIKTSGYSYAVDGIAHQYDR